MTAETIIRPSIVRKDIQRPIHKRAGKKDCNDYLTQHVPKRSTNLSRSVNSKLSYMRLKANSRRL